MDDPAQPSIEARRTHNARTTPPPTTLYPHIPSSSSLSWRSADIEKNINKKDFAIPRKDV
jgi:hypothetical protein